MSVSRRVLRPAAARPSCDVRATVGSARAAPAAAERREGARNVNPHQKHSPVPQDRLAGTSYHERPFARSRAKPGNSPSHWSVPTEPERRRRRSPTSWALLAARRSSALLVGATGLELATPCPPDRCANQAAPRPATSCLSFL